MMTIGVCRGLVWFGSPAGWTAAGWIDTPIYAVRGGQALIRYMNKPAWVPLPDALQTIDLNVKMEILAKGVEF